MLTITDKQQVKLREAYDNLSDAVCAMQDAHDSLAWEDWNQSDMPAFADNLKKIRNTLERQKRKFYELSSGPYLIKNTEAKDEARQSSAPVRQV